MKIIAITSRTSWDNRFLVELNDRELSRITGMQQRTVFEVGQSFDVDKAWDQMCAINSRKRDAKEAAETLRALATLLEGELPKIEAATDPTLEPSEAKQAEEAVAQ